MYVRSLLTYLHTAPACHNNIMFSHKLKLDYILELDKHICTLSNLFAPDEHHELRP